MSVGLRSLFFLEVGQYWYLGETLKKPPPGEEPQTRKKKYVATYYTSIYPPPPCRMIARVSRVSCTTCCFGLALSLPSFTSTGGGGRADPRLLEMGASAVPVHAQLQGLPLGRL